MLLTVSKRLEFSASRRLNDRTLSAVENRKLFGAETTARYGTGRNYVAYFVFSGDVDPVTGMLVNISEIKERAGEIVHERFDHKFLNDDHPAFRKMAPTAENIAQQLFDEVAPKFAGERAQLVACHLREAPDRSATYYSTGVREENHWFEFSAARRTGSPHLSAAENKKLFGDATRTHGHHYRARLTFRATAGESGNVAHDKLSTFTNALRDDLDHRELNSVADLKDRPMTTESLAKYIRDRASATLPIHRVRLHEREDFFAEAWRDQLMFLGMQLSFSAAHRLHVSQMTEAQNTELFGKCNNPAGHGHRYVVEATASGDYDERSGTLFNFDRFRDALAESVSPWRDRHLDLEAEDFRGTPSTGENIVRALWPKVDSRLAQQLARLRLWETANNRFTVRRM